MSKKPPGINIQRVLVCKHGETGVCYKCLEEFKEDLKSTKGGVAIEGQIVIPPGEEK